jgi:hypothetical protein
MAKAPVVSIPVRTMARKKEFKPRKVTRYYIQNGKILAATQIPRNFNAGSRLLAESEQITMVKVKPSFVHPRNSLRDIFLRFRLRHWDEHRLANPQLNMPEEIPYDIDRKKHLWPPFTQYVKERVILYRLAWKVYPEPSYVQLTSVRDTPTNTIARGIVTWRGVTDPKERVLTSMRKDDWRILDPKLGHCTFEVWEKHVRGEDKDYFLPRPVCFAKESKAKVEQDQKDLLDKIVASTKSR